jgi:hypothetical protein
MAKSRLTKDHWQEAGKKRRKHEHYRVTVTYGDGEQFGRTFSDKTRAEKYAARQQKNPIVKNTEIGKI